MRQSLALIASLMLVLTLWTGLSVSASHAAEIVGCIELSTGAGNHVAGDGDEVPGDADNPLPHHHGSCHNHHLNLPAIDGLVTMIPIARTALRIDPAIEPDTIIAARDLRPPIA
ncbi:hypothetical protein [Sphingobium sp. TomTYG45]